MTAPEPEVITLDVTGSQVSLRWDPGAVDAGSAWELESEPDWDRLEGIRLASALFDDGAALGVAAVRPESADGHGEDAVAARFHDADGMRIATSDALVSVEYDSARVPRRLGVEVWPDGDSSPIRVAADRDPTAEQAAVGGPGAIPMTFRVNGITGRGAYVTIRQS